MLRVLPWERRFLRSAFRRGVAEFGLSIARGNGKSTLTAGIGVAALAGPLVRQRGEVLCVASSFMQSRIIFEHALAFLRTLPEGRDAGERRSRWRVVDSTSRAMIENRDTGARLRCIGSDPRRAHGAAPFLVIADEPAQWPGSTADAMLSALRTSLGKLADSRLLAIGTRSALPEHWFEVMLKESGLSYAAAPDADAFDPRTWATANPSLRAFPALRAQIRREAEQARRNPSLLASFRSLRLNMGVPDILRPHLVSPEEWLRVERKRKKLPERAGPLVLGLDLGSTAAMSAAAGFWPATGRLEVVSAFPRKPGLGARGLADGVGNLYEKMAVEGHLVQLGSRTVPIPELLDVALRRFGRPAVVATDRFREAELRDALSASKFPRCRLELRGQGFKDGAADVRAFRRAVAEKKVRPERSLLLRAGMREAVVVGDPAGNWKLAKSSQGGRRKEARDDTVAACIVAVAEGSRMKVAPARKLRLVAL